MLEIFYFFLLYWTFSFRICAKLSAFSHLNQLIFNSYTPRFNLPSTILAIHSKTNIVLVKFSLFFIDHYRFQPKNKLTVRKSTVIYGNYCLGRCRQPFFYLFILVILALCLEWVSKDLNLTPFYGCQRSVWRFYVYLLLRLLLRHAIHLSVLCHMQ